MILVAGENLADLIAEPAAERTAEPITERTAEPDRPVGLRYRAHIGGSPYNVARGLGIMGQAAGYLCPFSSDALGQRLRRQLEASGGQALWPQAVKAPTSLALVSLDAQGQAQYQFYRDGVADRVGSTEALLAILPDRPTALHCGAMMFTEAEDAEKWLPVLAAVKARGGLIALDPNVRASVIADRAAYIARMAQVFALADVIKISDEDLAYLSPNPDAEAAARDLKRRAASPLVVLTRGAEGAVLLGDSAEASVPAVLPGPLVDTVGAGDSFQAALLSWLARGQIVSQAQLEALDEAALLALGRYAAAAAGINCTRAGAEPPTEAEILALLDSPS